MASGLIGDLRHAVHDARLRAAASVRQGGYAHLLRQALGHACAALFEAGRIEFYARELAPGGGAPRTTPDLALREATRDDLPALCALRAGVPAWSELQARFARGDRCFVALGGGELLHARWVSTQPTPIPELGRSIVPAAGEAYFYDGYTRPAARGTGVDARVREHIFASLAAAGFARAISYVRADNPAARRAARRAQRLVGALYYLRPRGRAPLVLRGSDRGLPALAARDAAQAELRTRAWRDWFEGWRSAPLAQRSTGYHSLPPEHFASTAASVVALLELDPARDEVLDVGCDSALVSRLVAPHCRRLVGMDLIEGLLTGAPAGAVRSADGSPMPLVAADARRLPLRAAAFDKVYCTGVVHTLPSRADAGRAIDELIRVCRPGGRVLVGAVPDLAKRGRARLAAFCAAGTGARLRMLAAWTLPRGLKRLLRRWAGLPEEDPMAFIEFDLAALGRELAARGLDCEVRDFPPEFWSRDFRRSRANLLVRLPPAAGAARAGPLGERGALTLEEVVDPARFAALGPEWEELLADSSADRPFLTWEWLSTWWRHLGGDRSLHLIAVREGRDLVAIAPFAQRPPRLARLAPFRVLEFLGTGTVGSDYLDLIVRRGARSAALAALAGRLAERGTIVELAQVCSAGAEAEALAAQLGARGWSIARTPSAVCPFVPLAGLDWDGYLATLGASHRANVRRRLRQLERAGAELRIARDEPERRALFRVLLELHHARWGTRGGSDAFGTPALVAFHDEASRLALARGWLRLQAMTLAGRPVAAHYGLRYREVFHFYQSGFDPREARRSVGLAMLAHTIRGAIAEGAREYDLLHGDESYKALWAREQRPLQRIELAPDAATGALLARCRGLRRHAKRLLGDGAVAQR